MKISIKENSNDVAKELEKETDVFSKRLSFQVFRALSLLEMEIKNNIRKGAGLHVRSGALLNSVKKEMFETSGGVIYGEVGPEGIPYAAIHEFGGTVVPKNKQFLAIPSDLNRRPDGQPRFTTSDLMGRSFIKNGTIFLKEGKNVLPMFFLKKSVEIPARPYLATAIASKKEEIFKEFGLFLQLSFK